MIIFFPRDVIRGVCAREVYFHRQLFFTKIRPTSKSSPIKKKKMLAGSSASLSSFSEPADPAIKEV